MVDTCVICGEIIPEGRQVCPNCEINILSHKPVEKQNVQKEEEQRHKGIGFHFFRECRR